MEKESYFSEFIAKERKKGKWWKVFFFFGWCDQAVASWLADWAYQVLLIERADDTTQLHARIVK